MPPISKLPPCRECHEPAHEELMNDGEVIVVERHRVGCRHIPLAPDAPPECDVVTFRYSRRLSRTCTVKF